jgi:hypothetical protein
LFDTTPAETPKAARVVLALISSAILVTVLGSTIVNVNVCP